MNNCFITLILQRFKTFPFIIISTKLGYAVTQVKDSSKKQYTITSTQGTY
jgi:hypothetical protein